MVMCEQMITLRLRVIHFLSSPSSFPSAGQHDASPLRWELRGDGRTKHTVPPYSWMLFFFALSFTQLLEGLIFGLLRLVWLMLLNLCSALRLDKAIFPLLKASDVGYQVLHG
jgi:hypothetical protein